MAEAAINEKANTRFRITVGQEARRSALEEHAVKMVLKNSRVDPNLPMIPQVERAVFRMSCMSCDSPFWGLAHHDLCADCQADQDERWELNKELQRLKNGLMLDDLREQVRKAKAKADAKAKRQVTA